MYLSIYLFISIYVCDGILFSHKERKEGRKEGGREGERESKRKKERKEKIINVSLLEAFSPSSLSSVFLCRLLGIYDIIQNLVDEKQIMPS